jgi:DNA-binding PadR family transcriptional regulator
MITVSRTVTVDLLQGTLEILILKAVSPGPLHGYGILLRIQQISGERLEIPQGSFYIALYRIKHKGCESSTRGGLRASGENQKIIDVQSSINSPPQVADSSDLRQKSGRR